MESKSKNSICIIVPMLNEEKVAGKCIDKILHEVKKLQISFHLIIVDDGSEDKTFQILSLKHNQNKKIITVLKHQKNLGYGAALKTGISKAIQKDFDFYLTMDSDLTNPPEDIKHFIRAIRNDVDCIKASRYIKGGGVVNVPLFRQFISIVGNYVASFFFDLGIKDCTNGFKLIRLDCLKGITFREENFSIILEEMYYLKKRGSRCIEIPNLLYARSNTKSHFKYKPEIFYDYFKYVIKAALL